MKRIILPDIHGEVESVFSIIEKEKPDSIILLGDYFDNPKIDKDIIKENFFKLLNLQKEYQENDKEFIMLIGNHDYHYMNSEERYSDYSYYTQKWAYDVLWKLYKEKKIQFCYIDEINKIIISHAGVSNTWLKESCKTAITYPNGITIYDINNTNFNFFELQWLECYERHGDTKYNSPIWIRPYSLLNDFYKDENGLEWKQIVGHTKMKVKPFYLENKLLILEAVDKYYLVQEFDNDKKLTKEEVKLWKKSL